MSITTRQLAREDSYAVDSFSRDADRNITEIIIAVSDSTGDEACMILNKTEAMDLASRILSRFVKD